LVPSLKKDCAVMSAALTISAAQDAIRAGQLTAGELLDLALARIRRDEERIRAWVLVDEAGARAAAEQLDRAAARGQSLGPLHGIPIGVKDLIDVAALPTVAGAPWRRDAIATEDAPLVARLRQAGAIILGKTVTTQLAYLDPAPTRNPWNIAHTPGGSSSGSAAAVASGMCMAAVGTQTGGSILRPAAYCGLIGCKPTWGCIPTAGIVPLAPSLDTPGLFARCIADAALLLAVMQGPTMPRSEDFAPRAEAAPRLGFIDEYFMAWADDSVQEAIEATAEKLHAAGATIEPVNLPGSFPQVEASARRIMAADAAEAHRQDFGEHAIDFRPQIAALITEGLQLDPAELAAARDHQQRFAAEMAAVFAARHSADRSQPLRILMMPTTPTPAPARLDTTGDGRFNIPWSFARLPAATIPCGLSPQGMPIGLQLVGPPHSESQLLSVAAWCERIINFNAAPPE
jgi:aspartyl-tRNA(Asn)/glutamyl-tRNA(Gln) amidotransferase subunit A